MLLTEERTKEDKKALDDAKSIKAFLVQDFSYFASIKPLIYILIVRRSLQKIGWIESRKEIILYLE